MNIFNKPLSKADENDLLLLIENKVMESRHIDYKCNLDLKSDKLKENFIHDIVAFANTYGGFLIYGVQENKGHPISLDGFLNDDIDRLKQQIQNLISSKIEPVLIGYEIRHKFSNAMILLI